MKPVTSRRVHMCLHESGLQVVARRHRPTAIEADYRKQLLKSSHYASRSKPNNGSKRHKKQAQKVQERRQAVPTRTLKLKSKPIALKAHKKQLGLSRKREHPESAACVPQYQMQHRPINTKCRSMEKCKTYTGKDRRPNDFLGKGLLHTNSVVHSCMAAAMSESLSHRTKPRTVADI